LGMEQDFVGTREDLKVGKMAGHAMLNEPVQ
jgi:hypothetical protein